MLFFYEDKNMSVTNQLEIDIRAKSDKATTSLDKLISKLNEVNTALDSLNTAKIEQISSSLKGISTAKVNTSGSGSSSSSSSSASNSTVSDNTKVTNSFNKLYKALTQTNTGMISFRGTLTKMAVAWGTFYAAMYPVIRLFDFFGEKVEDAMDYTETYNYFKVTMNKIGADAGEEFVNSFYDQITTLNEKMSGFRLGSNGELFENNEKSLGLDPTLLMDFQAKIGAVTNSVGLLGSESIATQKALSMLSADLSSLKNEDLDSVMTNLSSGLIGQSRALYKYGIDITNATLKTVAYEHGVTKSVSAMTQAEKMELRVLAILEQSKVAWGDQANTISSVANQYRILQQQLSNLGRVIGNLLLPIVSKVLPYLNALVIVMRKVFTLLGMKFYGSNWLSDLNDGISEGNFSGLTDDIDDVTDSLDDATSSAKKLQSATMGFDELNIINPNTSSGSSSGTSSGISGLGLDDDIDSALAEYEAVWNDAFDNMKNKAEEMANRFMSYVNAQNWFGLGKWFSDSLASQLNSIDWDKVYSGAKSFGTGLAEFLNGLVQPSTFAAIGKTVANSLNTAIYTAMAFAETFDFKNLGEAIAAYWNSAFTNFDFTAFGKTVGLWVGGITKTIATAIKNIKWDELFDGFKEALTGFFKGLKESDVTISDIAIVLGALTIKKILKLSWGAAVLKMISSSLSKGVVTLLGEYFGIAFAEDATIGTAIATGLSTQMAKIRPMLQNMKAYSIGDVVFGDFSSLNAAMTTTFGTLTTSLVGITSIVGGATLAIHEFFDMWEDGWSVLSEILKDLGIAIAAFGAVALGIVSGPAALLVGLIAAIGSTAAVVAHDQMIDFGDMLKEALTNPGGVSVSELTGNAVDRILEVGDAFGSLSSKIEQSDQMQETISNITDKMMDIKYAMDAGVKSVDDGVAEMSTQFEELYNATKEWYDLMAIEVQQVFGEGGVFEGALEKQGTTVESVTEAITGLETETLKAMTDAWEEYQSLPIEEKQGKRGQELLAIITSQTNDYEDVINTFAGDVDAILGDIDWDELLNPDGTIDEEAFKAELGKITDAITTTTQEIEEVSNSMISDLEDLKQQAIKSGDEQATAALDAAIKSISSGTDELKTQVIQSGIDASNALQQDLLYKMRDSIGSAEDISTALGLSDKYTKAIGTASADIEDAFGELGVSGAGWAADANDEIQDALFTYDTDENSKTYMQTTLSNDWEDIINGVADTTYEVAKENGAYIVQGIGEGAENQTEETADSMASGFFDGLWKKICDFFDINSPAKAMNPLGEYIFQGIMVGFESLFGDFDKSVKKFFEENVQPWFTLKKWEEIGQGIHDGLFNKFTEFTDWWTNTGIPDWWDNNVVPIFSEENWTFDGIKKGLKESFTKALTAVKQLWNNFADWINENLTWHIDPLVIGGKTVFSGADIKLAHLPKFNIPAYSIGGFPEDGLFFANSGEMVGEFSNGQNAVANNEQIVAGISSGVMTAITQTIAPYLKDLTSYASETASNTDSIAKKPTQSLTDRGIAKANIRGQRSLGLQLRTT